jgi:hypothetical protein
MDIITRNKGFVVFIKPKSEKLHDVPSPSICWVLGGAGGFLLGYLIEGTAETYKSQQFLNDVAMRFCQTYGAELVDTPTTEPIIDNGLRYELSTLTEGLESLKRRAATFPESKRAYGEKEDRLFWLAKEFCEQRLKIGNERFTEFDIKQVILAAGGAYSEAKAKAKSIYNYYQKNGFTASKRTFKMSREKHMRKINEERKNKAKAAVLSAVTSMQFLNEKISAQRVANNARVGKTTAAKYIKELKEEGLM